MKKWLFVGLALLVLSGLAMGVSLTVAIIANETPKTHEQLLSTVQTLHVIWYAALGFQLVGSWVTWKGFARSKSRLLKYASVVVACDIGSFLIAFELSNAYPAWAWTVFRSLEW